MSGVDREIPGKFYDKGGAVFHVKHPDFGAIGDGSTDDYAALVLAKAAAASGGILHFPAGTYKIGTNFDFGSTVTVILSPGAILKPANGVTVTVGGQVYGTLGTSFDTSLGGSFSYRSEDISIAGDLVVTGAFSLTGSGGISVKDLDNLGATETGYLGIGGYLSVGYTGSQTYPVSITSVSAGGKNIPFMYATFGTVGGFPREGFWTIRSYGSDGNLGDAGGIRIRRYGGTPDAFTIVTNPMTYGSIYWQGYDGVTTTNAAMLQANVDGTPGAGDLPGRITFWTAPQGGSLTERFRVGSNGNLGMTATKKFYVDGVVSTGNTYFTESAADTFDLVVGGTTTLSIVIGNVGIKPTSAAIAGLDIQRVTSTWSGYLFHMGSDASDTQSALGSITMANAASSGPHIAFEHYRGTHAAITPTQANDILGQILFGGASANGTRSGSQAQIEAVASETYTSTARGSYLNFYTTLDGASAKAARFRVLSNLSGVAIVATGKFLFDGLAGTGDTYVTESSANVLDFYVGGANSFRLTSTLNTSLVPLTIQGGTSSTAAMLIQGSASAGNGLPLATFQNTFGATNNNSSFRFSNSAGTELFSFGVDLNANGGRDFYIYDNGGTGVKHRLVIDSSGGLHIIATAKFYLDGTTASGDTYITESSANTFDLVVGGTTIIRATSVVAITGTTTVTHATKHFAARIPGDTQDRFNVSADTLNFGDGTNAPDTNLYRGAAHLLRTEDAMYVGRDFILATTKFLYLDGSSGAGGDTYITESSSNIIDLYTGGSNILKLSSTLLTILSGADLKLGVAAAAAAAVVSTHKLAVKDNTGTVYYLLASNV